MILLIKFNRFSLRKLYLKSSFSQTIDASKSTIKLDKELLKAFPDLNKVINLKRHGKYKQAIDIVDSTYKIMSNATGSDSAASTSLLQVLINLDYLAGNYKKIEDQFKSNPSLQKPSEFKLKNLLILSLCHLQQHEVDKGLAAADEAIEICEDREAEDMFPSCYGMKGKLFSTIMHIDTVAIIIYTTGLLHMSKNEFYNAETYYQKSVRYADKSIFDIFVSLSNLGNLHWLLRDPTLPTSNHTSSVPSSADDISVSSSGGNDSNYYNSQLQQLDFSQLPISHYHNLQQSTTTTAPPPQTNANPPEINSQQTSGLSPNQIDQIQRALSFWKEACHIVERLKDVDGYDAEGFPVIHDEPEDTVRANACVCIYREYKCICI